MTHRPFLLIAHHEHPLLTLLDAHSLQTRSEFLAPGRTAILGTSANHRYGFAVHRAADRVTIIDGESGMVSDVIQTDTEPTHFHAYEDHVLIFNDGAGSLSLFHIPELPTDGAMRVFKAAQPDHGSAVMIDDCLLVGYLRAGRVDVYHIGANEPFQQFDDCPTLHGAACYDQTALFGCSDGVLLLKKEGSAFTPVKLTTPPDSPPRVRVGVFAAHPAQPIVLGNFGAGLALIDTHQQAMRILPLPAPPLKFAFDHAGETIFVLTHDGVLHHVTLEGDIIASAAVVGAVEPPKGPDGKARPSFAVSDTSLYVVSPDEERLLMVDIKTLSVRFESRLPDKPNQIVYLA